MIEAVAAVQCGSKASLDAAVAKNEVKRGRHNGIDMYFFPKVKFGRSAFMGHTIEASRDKDAAVGTFGEFKSFFDTTSFGLTDIDSLQITPVAFIHCGHSFALCQCRQRSSLQAVRCVFEDVCITQIAPLDLDVFSMHCSI